MPIHMDRSHLHHGGTHMLEHYYVRKKDQAWLTRIVISSANLTFK